jgi:hypothetical protein
MSLFRRLLRPNATSVDRPGIDEISPAPKLTSQLWWVGMTPVDRRSGHPSTMFHGSITGPIPVGPTPTFDVRPPPMRESHYNRARHGEGLFGTTPLIPEGEVD